MILCCDLFLKIFSLTSQHRHVYIITEYVDFNYQKINKILENGADGYLLNSTTGEELHEALKQILNGKIYLTLEVQQILIKGMRDFKNIPTLTNKEKEVLQFISKGLTNKVIAVKMNVGEETIKSHRKNIMGKLNIHKTAELVRFAIEMKLIS